MNEKYTLPRPQRLLGEALRPVWQNHVAAGANMLSKEVFQNDAASDEAVQAAVARFDASLNGLLAGYGIVRCFAVQGEDVYSNHLLGRGLCWRARPGHWQGLVWR